MKYLLSYWVWTALMVAPQSATKSFHSMEALRTFAKDNRIHKGSIFEVNKNERGVATLRFVSGV